MNKGKTFQELGKQPIGHNLIDMGQLTAELRHTNHETIHKLADVLNPVATSMSVLIKDAAKSISDLSTTWSSIERQMNKSIGEWKEVGRGAREEVEVASKMAAERIREFQSVTIKTRATRFLETVVAGTIIGLLTMYFYMHFLN